MTQYKHPTIDDLRYHTEVGTGFTKDAMLNIAADWIEALQAELSASPTTDTVTLSKAEYDALVKDAERWRFLMANNYFSVCKYSNDKYADLFVLDDINEIDRAIDRAKDE
jgi:hypothetical protein